MKNYIFKMLILLSFSTLSFSQKLPQKVFEGKIQNKIPISLSLTFDNNVVYGNIIYRKKGIPIRIIGRLDKNGALFLNELMPNGLCMGIFSVMLKENKIEGDWFTGDNEKRKEYKVSLIKTSETTIFETPLIEVTGTYKYHYDNEGPSGNLGVQQIGKNKIAVAIDCIRGKPSYNMAQIDKTILEFTHNQAIYYNTEFGKCKFKITFLKNGVNVQYVDDAYDCGFGNAATVTGNFIKINSKKPKF
jgi:hypothetical protein